MTRSERAKLRTEMRRIISGMEQTGERATTQDVCQRIVFECPEVLDDETIRKLAMREMQNMARGLMKAAVKKGHRDAIVLDLFSGAGAVELPSCIAVAVDGVREKEWGSTFKSTLAELNSYIASLYSGANADIAKAKRVEAALVALMNASEGDEMDTTIGEIITMMRQDKRAHRRL